MSETCVLTPMSNNELPPCVVQPGESAMVGRLIENDLCLPVESVSRRHATILMRGPRWYVIDLGSKASTKLNNVVLEPHHPTPLSDGDVVQFGPVSYRVRIGDHGAVRASMSDDDDETSTSFASVTAPSDDMANQRLTLLSDVIERFVAVPDEQSLYDVALQTAIDGSGFARAAFIRPIGSDGAIELVASARRGDADDQSFTFSSSLVKKAANGEIVTLRGRAGQQSVTEQSIVQLQIHSALCAPMFFAGTIEGFLYLDARGEESEVAPDAAAFCRLLSRAFALALSSVRRIDLERRQQRLAAELRAARHVQQMMMPSMFGAFGSIEYAVKTRPGVIVAGDLFDIFTLPDGRQMICFGDVSGHGVDAGLIMALVQSYLHARLCETGDLTQCVKGLNAYIQGRTDESRFVTLWVGALSSDGRLEYIDAGHGYAAFGRGGNVTLGDSADHIPVGIFADHAYTTAERTLSPGDQIILFSDGLVEQTDPSQDQFGKERLIALLQSDVTPTAMVEHVFDSIQAFASHVPWNDDATIATIRFAGTSK